MSNAKHTPGEWKMEPKYKTSAIDSNGKTIFTCALTDFMNQDKKTANAERIVRAVNSYDDMLEALKKSHNTMVRANRLIRSLIDQIGRNPDQSETCDAIRETLSIVSKNIAKAENNH